MLELYIPCAGEHAAGDFASAERERIAEGREAERLRVEEMRQRADDARQRADEKAERDRWFSASEAAQGRIAQLTAKAAELEKRRRRWWPFRRAG